MAKFVVRGLGEFPWEPTSMKLREAVELEHAFGRPVSELIADYNGELHPTRKGIRGWLGVYAMLYLAMRRNGRAVTLDELNEVDVSDITEIHDTVIAVEAQDPPVQPAAKRRPAGSGRGPASSKKR